jgi:hypothetical protein
MTPEHEAILAYTVSHFQEVARQNLFPENAAVEHDTDRCVICHPELLPLEPFAIYLEVVTQSVKVRRPHLDQGLVDEINNDLTLMGLPGHVSIESLRRGEPESVQHWRNWLRDAISTGLGLLSIHSATSQEFDLDEAEAGGFTPLVARKVDELIDCQKRCAVC